MATIKLADKVSTKVEAFALARQIELLLDGRNVDAALSALNYCIASLIHDHCANVDEALANSDEQTRFVVSVLATDKLH
jgi:hypothetical protein